MLTAYLCRMGGLFVLRKVLSMPGDMHGKQEGEHYVIKKVQCIRIGGKMAGILAGKRYL